MRFVGYDIPGIFIMESYSYDMGSHLVKTDLTQPLDERKVDSTS